MTPKQFKGKRLRLNMSQPEFARLTGISQSMISRYELGGRAIPERIAQLVRLATKRRKPKPPIGIDAERIIAIRKRYGLTRKKLAAIIGRSPGLINLYESGKRKPSEEVARKLIEMEEADG